MSAATCTSCGSRECGADWSHKDGAGGIDHRVTALHMAACRDRTRSRAERAEAEVRACCGEVETLGLHLPDGWRRSERNYGEYRAVSWCTVAADEDGNPLAYATSDGAWGCGLLYGREPGIFAAMAAAEAALAARGEQ